MNINFRIFFVALVISFQTLASPIQFEDTSDKLGFTRGTETWGIAWGHLNTDKYPDLWNQAHRDFPRLYKNTGDGDFDDVTMVYDRAMNGYWLNDTSRDVHSGAWGDYDNDGDDDLLVGDQSDLFINQANSGGYFIDGSLQNSNQTATWNNTDGDRALESDNICGGSGQYMLLFDLDNDGDIEKVCGTARVNGGAFPYSVHGASSSLIPSISLTNDAAIGDFNNDLRTDIILTRGSNRPNGASKTGNNAIEAWFRTGSATQFTFSASGEVVFLIDGNSGGPYLEADRYILNSNGNTSGGSRGISISYTGGQWKVLYTGVEQAYVRIRAQDTVSEPVMGPLDNPDKPQQTAHGINTSSGINWVYTTGLNEPKSCGSVVAADFDNDMDLDLYMACRNGVENLSNRYFDNNGNGSFTEVFSHGGEGPVGAGLKFGVADSVVTADYDIDGFIDLAVSNGLLYYPVSLGGPDTLIRNKGNGNHWMELDLIGTISPRAAIGAKVYLTAGGVTQLREQSGGYHRWSQNHTRIHFGLAGHTIVDEIRIEWPSGQVDTYSNISADALYDVEENGAIYPASLGQPEPVTIAPGEECGEPPYASTLGPVLHLWRLCGTDDWRMRIKGGLGRLVEHQALIAEGTIVGSGVKFRSASGTSTDGNDIVDNTINTVIDFKLTVSADNVNAKGINFNNRGQTSTCLFLEGDSHAFEAAYIGSTGKRIDLPFDFVNLSPCSIDTDGDGIIDSLDDDDDNDGVLDIDDAFPLDPSESADSDNDGVGDNADVFPNDSSETRDSDADGIGDNSDIDNDNDGLTNNSERIYFGVGVSASNSIIKTNSDFYLIGSMITVEFFNGPGGGHDWIGVLTAGETDFHQYLTYEYIPNSTSDGSVSFSSADLGVGVYDIYYFPDNGYVPIDSPLTITIGIPSIDMDGDGVVNSSDLDSDNDTIADIVEAGLIDADGDFLVDDLLNDQGSVVSPPDTDGDGIPDYFDLESNNAANDGTRFDILNSVYVSFDTNNDGMLSNADVNGGVDADSDGIDDLIDSNPFEPGTGPITPKAIVSIADLTVNEGGKAVMTISLSKAFSQNVVVNYATADVSAIDAVDYTGRSGTIVFAPGDTVKTRTVTTLQDTLVEGDEQFTMTLSNPVNATLGQSIGTATITENVATDVIVSIADRTVNEGGRAVMTISLSKPVSQNVVVAYATADVSATDGVDYTGRSGTIVFAPGDTVKTRTVTTLQDTVVEGDEQFTMTLSNPVNATLGQSIGTATITENVATDVIVSIADRTVNEGGRAVMTISLSKPVSQIVVVNYATADVSATDAVDYTGRSGTIVFAAGDTVKTRTVTTLQDTLVEADEQFTMTLSNPVNATLGQSIGTAIIVDDDI